MQKSLGGNVDASITRTISISLHSLHLVTSPLEVCVCVRVFFFSIQFHLNLHAIAFYNANERMVNENVSLQ